MKIHRHSHVYSGVYVTDDVTGVSVTVHRGVAHEPRNSGVRVEFLYTTKDVIFLQREHVTDLTFIHVMFKTSEQYRLGVLTENFN